MESRGVCRALFLFFCFRGIEGDGSRSNTTMGQTSCVSSEIEKYHLRARITSYLNVPRLIEKGALS